MRTADVVHFQPESALIARDQLILTRLVRGWFAHVGKAATLAHRARDHQPAMLCTLVMTENTDSTGVARYPVGTLPIMDPDTGETLVDSEGRRSFTTSIAYGPTIGRNIALGYLPCAHAVKGKRFQVEYFGETYPVEVAGVGYEPLYDPENRKPQT